MEANDLYIGVDIAKGQDVVYISEWMILEDNSEVLT